MKEISTDTPLITYKLMTQKGFPRKNQTSILANKFAFDCKKS